MEATTGTTLFAPDSLAESPTVELSDSCSGDDALYTGISLILADAARSHLKSGDLDKANLCLVEAERWMGSLHSA